MWCVTLLTVLYFGLHLYLMAAAIVGAISKFAQKWTANVLRGVQASLAFVPMLCIMMISVRMRAMQLGIQDPQRWAKVAMTTATSAVVLQASCSLLHPGNSDEDVEDVALVVKVFLLLSTMLRYLAAVVLYISVGVLIAALFMMRPDSDPRI